MDKDAPRLDRTVCAVCSFTHQHNVNCLAFSNRLYINATIWLHAGEEPGRSYICFAILSFGYPINFAFTNCGNACTTNPNRIGQVVFDSLGARLIKFFLYACKLNLLVFAPHNNRSETRAT